MTLSTLPGYWLSRRTSLCLDLLPKHMLLKVDLIEALCILNVVEHGTCCALAQFVLAWLHSLQSTIC